MVVAITVSDFGPIKSAAIVVKPLTVFVGPNNAGKSVLATVVYAALGKRPHFSSTFGSRFRRFPSESTDARQETLSALEEHAGWLESTVTQHPTSLSDTTIPSDIESVLTERVRDGLTAYSRSFVSELERCFSAKLPEPRRAQDGTTRTRVLVRSTSPAWELAVSVTARRNTIKLDPPDIPSLLRSCLQTMSKATRLEILHQPSGTGFEILATDMVRACFRSFPRGSRYLPAARSGLLQSQKVLTRALIRRSSLAGVEDVDMPALSGLITDFLSEMVTLTEVNNMFFEGEAAALEERLLKGTIDVESIASAAPEIRYKTRAASFPLNRTSSMVSEIAPIVLYLRHVLLPDDLLIVEEPEAHLHPASQTALAEVLGQLANNRLDIVLTTHSEFFLQQLSNLIVASGVDRRTALDVGIEPSSIISPEKVGAYIFMTSDDRTGTIVEELEVSRTSGLSEASFIGVAEALYNQSVKLDSNPVE